MTDNKIIEGLDCCRIENCHECPYREYYDCRGTLVQDTFDLINRQNSEIEKLNADIDGACIFLEEHRKISKQEHENQMKMLNQIKEQIPLSIARARNEAIKEFAERLLDKYDIWTESDATEYQYVDELVNNLVEEMTGEKNKMTCRECGAKMYLDDRDTNFKGNYDNYWNCEECQTSCIEQVRFAQSFKEIWHSENNNEVKDYEIKHKIVRT